MQCTWWTVTFWLLAAVTGAQEPSFADAPAFQPEFAEPIINLTVPLGRDATFRCLVTNLGGYRVGWVKADTKAIQAIHIHVVTHNPRVSVSHAGGAWNLHIRAVQEEDRGHYMCQINTDPMQSQIGHLDVVVPPDFVVEETSGDTMVPEGGAARVACRARGTPTPRVTWRREDGADIVVREANGMKTRVTVFESEVLKLTKISRSEMGAYLCIASNGVPPSVSKRIMIKVHFHPVIQVPNQLVGAPLGTDVTLECHVEASPKSINYWVRDSNEMVISSNKYDVSSVARSAFESRLSLTVRRLTTEDLGGYRCVAKNSLGEVDSNIRLYEIPGPNQIQQSRYRAEDNPEYSPEAEDLDSEMGSAEESNDDEDDDNIAKADLPITKNKNRSNKVDNFGNNIKTNHSKNKIGKSSTKLNTEMSFHSGCTKAHLFAHFLYAAFLRLVVFVSR